MRQGIPGPRLGDVGICVMDDEKTREDAAAHHDAGRPTLKTIAFMTQLGVTTVSRALKDAPEIGLETRRRVQLVAKQVGYRPNRAGVRLRTGKTNVISLVLDTDEQIMGFISEMIAGVSEALASTPYHLILTPYSRSRDRMDPVRYLVETGSADGVIISRIEPDDPRVRYMLERGIPFATHGRTELAAAHPFHDFDNHAFAGLAVRELVRRDRTKLALLSPPLALTYHHHTANGFAEALTESGATGVPFNAVNIDSSMDQIRRCTAELMRRKNRPDGIISSAAAATLAVVAGIEDAGMTVGREVDVVSKQSTPLLHLFRPAILVVNEDFRLAGRELARSVLGWIDGRDPGTLSSLSVPDTVESYPAAARP